MDDFSQELAEAVAEQATCVCGGSGVLGKEWLYKRESECDCGAGSPSDELTQHDVRCDSVPCPFCVLTGKIRLHP
jgi:hypothetical protein